MSGTMSTIIVAAIVAIGAIISPLLLSSLTIRQQRIMKREDYARQDLVAERAEATARAVAERQDAIALATTEAARLLLERQDAIAAEVKGVATKADETAELLVSANADVADKVALVAENAGQVASKVAIVAENADRVDKKLDIIHVLVNSAMTAAIQSEYDATVNNLAMMREVVELRRAAGQGEPNPDTMAAIKTIETKIRELKETLAERHRQDELAKAQSVKIVAAEGLDRPLPDRPKDP